MELRILNKELRIKSKIFTLAVLFCLFLIALYAFYSPTSHAAVEDEISARQRQIDELQRQIEEYQKEIENNQSQARTLEREISSLNTEIKQIELTIKSLQLSVNQTSYEISTTESEISGIEDKMLKHRNAIAEFLKITYESDQKTLTEILLSNDNISDFFSALNSLRINQEKLQVTIDEMKKLKTNLEEKQESLEDKKTELERSLSLEAIEKRNLDRNKSSVNKILKETKGQEKKFQDLVIKSKKDLETLRAQITYLEQNGVSVEDAVKYAQLAAIRAGIRPAFLLAELEQESGLGANVGKCYLADITTGSSRHITTGKVYARGINPTRDLPHFLTITRELGMDSLQTPISCWPGFGWGGAMGPAQFIPSTWMGYREEVARLTGHSIPNPWNVEDAFMAAAAKLAKDGANSQTKAGEIAASKRYYCGSASSTKRTCVNYANSVQRKAAEIEKSL